MGRDMSVAIVGMGAVGKALLQLFPDAVEYDEPKCIGTREAVNACRYAFVCVPTPRGPDGACDTRIVEDVVDWIEADYIVIRSTVAPGTTRRLAERTGKHIVFQPEYGPAETPDHPFNNLRNIRWVILGGEREARHGVIELYQRVFNASITIHQTTPETAELCKYMENSFLALKVIFCNEFFDIAKSFEVDYHELRELWLLDPRIEPTHSFVFPDSRGFAGGCLPKDIDAIVEATRGRTGMAPMLMSTVASYNRALRNEC